MFKKVMLCTDLTPASDALVHCVEIMKNVGTQEVILAHVIHVANTPGLEESLIGEATPILERQQRTLEEQGLKVTLEMQLGMPAHTLAEMAEKHDASVLLVGSHGKGIIKTATLGSVSTKLLHQTRRPLLLARMELLKEGPTEVCRNMFANILFPTDFSETAERALDYLGKIALETGCPVTLMHVITAKDQDDPDAAKRHEEDARYLLEAKKRRLKTLGAAEVNIELVHGAAADEIISRTREGGFSLAVMGGHGKGVLKELILGSTANEVARHAAVPLLFVPAEGEEMK